MNDEQALVVARKARVTINYDTHTGMMHVDADTVSPDETLNMLQMAMRAVEDQRRMCLVQAIQKQHADAARTAQIIGNISRRN